MFYDGKDLDMEVGDCYRKAAYLKSYEHFLQPMKGKVFWPKTGKVPMAPSLVEKKKSW